MPDLSFGGAQRVVSELLNNIVSIPGNHVKLILLFKDECFFSLNSDVEVKCLHNSPSMSMTNMIHSLCKLRKEVVNWETDVVLSFHQRYNPFVIMSLVGTGIPVFVSDRSNPYNKLSPKINEFFRKILYPKAQGLIVQTNLSAMVKMKLNKNILVMPNPLKCMNYYEDMSQKENIIINVGRMDKEKGHHELVKIFSMIIDKGGWKLCFVGDGPERNNIEKYVKELSLTDSVIFLGARKDVDVLLAKSKIFAFTSLSEGYPNALLEAMAMGLPCISFDCIAGPSDLINNGDRGILVPLNNYDEYARCLKNLMNDEALRRKLGENAKYVRQQNDIHKITKSLLSFINK